MYTFGCIPVCMCAHVYIHAYIFVCLKNYVELNISIHMSNRYVNTSIMSVYTYISFLNIHPQINFKHISVMISYILKLVQDQLSFQHCMYISD